MNKLMTVAVAALALTAFAAENDGARKFSRANGPAAGERGVFPRGGSGFVPAGDSTAAVASNPKLAEAIGLSQEARDQIKKAEADYRKELVGLQARIHEAMNKQAELMKADKPDEAAVMAAVDELFEGRKAMAKAQARRTLAVKGLLTPEQLEKAKTAIQREREERRGRRSAERRPQRPAPAAPKAADEAGK